MSLHLILPGLIWPHSTILSPAANLNLPGLSYLLGRTTCQIQPFSPFEHLLTGLFKLDGAIAPLGSLRHRGESTTQSTDSNTEWLCADPIHLHFAQDQPLIDGFSEAEIDVDSARILVNALNETIGSAGKIEIAASNRWYLRLSTPCHATLFPLNDVLGRPFAHFMPEGQDQNRWLHLLNELQVTLYNHPLNQQREEQGLRSINAVWLWGNGSSPSKPVAPCPTIQTTDPLMRGLSIAAGITPAPPDSKQAIAGSALVLLDSLRAATQRLEVAEWRDALLELEKHWFAPLAYAHQHGHLTRLHITAPGDHYTVNLALSKIARWQFWRAPCTLASFLNTLPSSAKVSTAPPSFSS